MEYVINTSTNKEIFFHASKNGIEGTPNPHHNDSKKKRDFGDGFYLGSKERQTIALVNSSPDAKLYKYKIPNDLLNSENTLFLTKQDWMYFVLYNRGYLEPIKHTEFYQYYAHIADNKDYIVGPIADDVFSTCMQDFVKGIITDYMFMQLIDCYSYGTQIVAKTQDACDNLVPYSFKNLTATDRMNALETRKLNRHQQEIDYEERRAKLLLERKGKYISELFSDIEKGIIPTPISDFKQEMLKNIKFPETIKEHNENEKEIIQF